MKKSLKIAEEMLEAIYPSSLYCISCGSIIDRTRHYALCDDCIEKFHWAGKKTCDKCGKLLGKNYLHSLCYDCRESEREFDRGYTCARYSLYERAVLMDLKFNGKDHLGMKLGDALADRMHSENEHIDMVVPVPIHPKKLRKRGYNQAAVIAARFAKVSEGLGDCVYRDLLVRTRATAPMKGLDAPERRENVNGAFAVKKGMGFIVKDKNIAVVDDIFTTGSTVDECSRVLKECGAKRIIVLSFAAGGNRMPQPERSKE